MKTVYVSDLKPGSNIEGQTFAVVESERANDKNNNPYYNVTLSDRTGRVSGKVWADAIANVDSKSLRTGKLVTIDAVVEEYRGSVQINIKTLKVADENKIDAYLQASSFDAEEMLAELQQICLEEITNPDIRKMFTAMFADNDLVHKLKYWPAGISIHHAFRSGLLQHILETVSMAKALVRFYPDIDFDIAKAGIILHDLGKVEELDASGAAPYYTIKGTVLGHIHIGTEILDKYFPTDGDEKTHLHLKHIILSHHGEREKGSSVLPSTPEAMLVFQLEDASSKIQLADSSVKENVQDSGLTTFNKYLQRWMWAERNPESDEEEPVFSLED